MGFFDKLFGKKEEPAAPAVAKREGPLTVACPLNGEAIALADIGDGVFSEAILGPGCGIRPSDGQVFAPFDGTVTQVAETLHAVGLTTSDGVEILIHVGMDTVEMKGEGFKVLVKVGDVVTVGQPLLKADLAAIEAAGHPTTTAIIIMESDRVASVEPLKTGAVQKGDALLQVNVQ